MSNFIQNCLAGKSLLEDIDDYVDQWHESDSEIPLHVYLGMNHEEYVAWVKMPPILSYIILAHKDSITYSDALSQAAAMAARSTSINSTSQIESWLRSKNFDL